MDVSSSLLVAIMFVTILGMGIANILTTLSSLVDRQTRLKTYGVHTGWIVLLLLIYLNLFWNLIDIFAIDVWKFRDFLFAICGPVVLFFATSVILPQATNENAADMKNHYYGVSRQFFQFMALLQLWSLGAEGILLGSLTTLNIFNGLVFLFFLVLAYSKEERVHRLGLGLSWLIFLIAIGLQGFEVMS